MIPQALANMPFHGVDIEIPLGDLKSSLRQMASQIIERLVDPEAVSLRRLAMLEADRIAALDPVEGADMWSTSLQSIVRLLATHAEGGEIVTDDLEVAADLFLAMVAGGPTVWADFGCFAPPRSWNVTSHAPSISSSPGSCRVADDGDSLGRRGPILR